MPSKKLRADALCHALMAQVVDDAEEIATQRVQWLRSGPKNAVEADMARDLLLLQSLGFTDEQLSTLKRILLDVQVSVLANLLSLIDGTRQPEEWPDKIRLVDRDHDEDICPEQLEWELIAAANRLQIWSKE